MKKNILFLILISTYMNTTSGFSGVMKRIPSQQSLHQALYDLAEELIKHYASSNQSQKDAEIQAIETLAHSKQVQKAIASVTKKEKSKPKSTKINPIKTIIPQPIPFNKKTL